MVTQSAVNTGLTLRSCAPEDADILSLVAQATFLDAYAGVLQGSDLLAFCQTHHSPAAYAALLSDPETQAYLLEAQPGAAPVGYAVLAEPNLPLPDLTADDVELKRIYLLSRFHGTGAARQLMEQCITFARQRGKRRLLLGVKAANERALRFYGKTGFQKVGTREFQVGQSRYHDYVLAYGLTAAR